MRAFDDIKETVRVAALTCWRALCSVCTRLCSAGGGGGATTSKGAGGGGAASGARGGGSTLLPLLLERGVGHAAEDVLQTLRQAAAEAVRGGGAAAPRAAHRPPRPPPPREPVRIGGPVAQLPPDARRFGGDFDASLEQARRRRPLLGVVDRVRDLPGAMGAAEISDVLPSVGGLLTRGVGLPTRTGAARFLMLLAQRDRSLLAPHAPKLLRTLQAAVLAGPPSPPAARTAAASEVAPRRRRRPVAALRPSSARRYVDEAGAATEEELQLTVATLLRELLRGASDAMATVATTGCAFVGRHEPLGGGDGQRVGDQAKQPGSWRRCGARRPTRPEGRRASRRSTFPSSSV